MSFKYLIKIWLESMRWYRRMRGGHWEWWCDRVGEKLCWIQVRECTKPHIAAVRANLHKEHVVLEYDYYGSRYCYYESERELVTYCNSALARDGIDNPSVMAFPMAGDDSGALLLPCVHVCESPTGSLLAATGPYR